MSCSVAPGPQGASRSDSPAARTVLACTTASTSAAAPKRRGRWPACDRRKSCCRPGPGLVADVKPALAPILQCEFPQRGFVMESSANFSRNKVAAGGRRQASEREAAASPDDAASSRRPRRGRREDLVSTAHGRPRTDSARRCGGPAAAQPGPMSEDRGARWGSTGSPARRPGSCRHHQEAPSAAATGREGSAHRRAGSRCTSAGGTRPAPRPGRACRA